MAALVLAGAATGIQPTEVENVTLQVELNASEIYRSGTQTTPGEYAPSNYPYLSSNKPEALVPYGDTKELTNIYMPDGLVAYYPLDETTGNTANDITTTLPNNNGQHQNFDENELGAPGNISRAYEFDGNSDYVEVSHSNQLSPDNITVSLWTKSPTSNWVGTGCMVSKRSAYIMHPDSGSTDVRWYIHDGGWINALSSPSDITRWHHYTGTYDGSDLKMYIDGELKSTTSHSGAIDNDNGHVLIGKDDEFENRHCSAKIDDVRIYNRSLSQKEVKRLYNYQKKDQPGTEQISATITSGGFILANTKGGTPSIESRSEPVKSRTLLSQVSPSFGFPQPRNPSATQIVYRSPYNLTGDSFSTTSSAIELRSIPEIGENATVSVTPAD